MSSEVPDDDNDARTATQAPPLLRPRRRRRRRRRPGAKLFAALREATVVLVCALVLSLLVTTFVARPFRIPSASMEVTLLEGDRLLVTPLVPGPLPLQRGDVVVFTDERGWLDDSSDDSDGSSERGAATGAVVEVLTFLRVLPDGSEGHLVKRVVGLPGDHVVCCDEQGRTSVNGVALDEAPYLRPGSSTDQVPFDVTVPDGELWVMGDNRGNSKDSRFHQATAGGFVAESAVVGRAVVVAWPLTRLGWLSRHSDVFAAVPDPGR
ncbi:signal peptidase I [Quadrisphaera granulorum]|uniref:Signal peptidase I n=1 Tax=Quadrisphaera granulorum TaxID=317664 RepID=A0A316AEH8_9ACTN|nr:signal peptidase I [Quadrisphaera granulorum]PWJ48177.1 signal peptidase I [Quadrisphaera granulorum]SZE98546.1 signal peptidase I [Quadrisphaera granulorum]